MRALILLALLAACARPLTPTERDFAAVTLGPTLDAGAVRLHDGVLIGGIVRSRPARPAITCRERIRPPETGDIPVATGAIALFQRVFVARPVFRRDYLSDYPDRMNLAEAMFLAHELTHVWQWQNRGRTGYHPLRAASEHVPQADPYLYDLTGRDFLSYPYEQQASLVEEFVCCRALAPEAGRTAQLRALLKPHFPGLATRDAVGTVTLPWLPPDLRGVCA